MSYIPYDVQLIIDRYLHQLYMIDIRNEIDNIKNDITLLNYLREKALYPYLFWDRIVKMKKMECNKYYITVIDKYVHKKRMFRCLESLKSI